MCLAAVGGGVPPGLVVLVAVEGQTVFHEAFGARQLVPRQLPALPDTMYDVASLTKAVATSVLAMQEVGAGRLTLDARVADLLAEFSSRTGEEPARNGITVRQLLCHS